MAKKSNLAASLDDVLSSASVVVTPSTPAPRRRSNTAADTTETVLVGANLPPRYARNLALLHAETGKSKKELLTEALDMLFVAKAGKNLL